MLRATRTALLECVSQLSETRVFRATDRDGWTVKHELAYLAAADRVLLAVIEEIHSVPGDAPVIVAPDGTSMRRLRGQQMHVTQELRLAPLCDELAALGERVAAAIEVSAEALGRPVALGDRAVPAYEHARAHLERALEGADRLRAALG